MNSRPTTRHSDLALQIARDDLAYIHGALTCSEDPAANWFFIQYATLVAYETREFHTRQLGHDLEAPLWEPTVALAARTSAKFFDDKRRMFSGVVEYFEQLAAANRALFFPARRLRLVDRLRTDLSVLTLDDVPVMSNVSGYFALGIDPHQLVALTSPGPQMRDLAAGVGQMIRLTQAPQGHTGPVPVTEGDVRWWDADSGSLWSQVFGGVLAAPVAAAVFAVQAAASTAFRIARSDCCEPCRRAAFKHRFIVAYQAFLAVEQLRESLGPALDARAQACLDAITGDRHCRQLRSTGYRRLRNGLVHLGLSDIPAQPGVELDLGAVLRHYTGAESEVEVGETVDAALEVAARELEQWCLTPPPGGSGLRGALHPAPN